jgi:hypothetical protein
MRRAKLDELTTKQLVDDFAANALKQDHAILYSEISKFNQHYSQMVATQEELKRRPGDQRSARLALYDHPNKQVRLQAARMSFAIAPDAARAVIEEIASGKGPQAGDAGVTLINLDRGIFKPT